MAKYEMISIPRKIYLSISEAIPVRLPGVSIPDSRYFCQCAPSVPVAALKGAPDFLKDGWYSDYATAQDFFWKLPWHHGSKTSLLSAGQSLCLNFCG
jgi:hypothetical protein